MNKKKVLEAVAKIGFNAALEAAGTTSHYGTYQPVEPKAIKELKIRK